VERGRIKNGLMPIFIQRDYPLGVRWFWLILKDNAFFMATPSILLVIVQAMLAVPFLHCPYRLTVKARHLLHKTLVFAVFAHHKEQRAHLPSKTT